jgi:putative hydrolase of the HAD superfamily
MNSMAGIRAALFDLDGTLSLSHSDTHENMLAIAQESGYTFAPKAQHAAIRWSHWYWSRPRADLEAEGAYGRDDDFWLQYVNQYLEVAAVPQQFWGPIRQRAGDYFEGRQWQEGYLAPGARRILWTLRERGYRLGLVSNRHHPLTGATIELGIVDHFDFTLSAGQAESRKPDGRIFEKSLEMAGGVAPHEAVYIGDNYYADVLGARRAGLQAVLIDRRGAFDGFAEDCVTMRDLEPLLILLP